MFFHRRKTNRRPRHFKIKQRKLALESLEQRRMLAIFWANQGSSNPTDPNYNSDGFDSVYTSIAGSARQIVKQAINDWEKVITDFNYDGDQNPLTNNSLNNTFTLNISATALTSSTARGETLGNLLTYFNGRPTAATIQLDDNGGGAS